MTTDDLVTHLIVLARAAEGQPDGTLWADSEALRTARREMTSALERWVATKINEHMTAVLNDARSRVGRSLS